ncbi:putative secreted protein [Streptomyces davaonensis JCM 4913]|uniref:Putative secreted protein n=1 Tax=Streptomyces davaonensis (strain DSM 101723 / JCM 4913 / KCC S-0913 / 768) TaxID=1214101 RepID=K4QY46_STRDJ|nr:DNRLRE domain-containing protein [Streptomyces davaonensis]CCK25993.1 putative secreted protein [Streptomyces davaonensis JCM 4913]
MYRQAGGDADPNPAPHPAPPRRRSRLKRFIAAAVGASLAAASLLLTGTAPAHAATTVHTYAPTGVGGGTTASPDVPSTKYQVQVAGTPVQAVKYTANRNNFDIARFASDSRTPTITVTLPSTTIDTVNVYPARYYPAGSVSVSADKHTLTFRMSAAAKLNQAIVMVNGDSTNAAGQPYLAVINDPLEGAGQRPDTTSAPDGSGVNLGTGVLNFQEFAAKYLAAHPNSEAQNAPAAQTSSMAGKSVNGTAIPAGQQTSAGSLVSASTVNVRYPKVRTMAAGDVTYALKAAIDTIKANPTALNTLYFPNGTYVSSGLLINGLDGSKLKGGKLKVYTDEGALLKNRIQAYMEAFEPAVGIINSRNIEFDGRGVFDGNGVANYNAGSSGDRHDANSSQHQGGVMVMHSSDITFDDTYVRDSKQWNYETHGAKRVRFNNIKALTPYGQPWIDGTNFASGQDIAANGVFTLGNDDAFASGHYNPSDGFTPLAPGVWNNFKLGTSTPDIQGYVDAAGAHDTVADALGFDNYHWDHEDTKNISVSNTLNWSVGAGNAIRIGLPGYGYRTNSYTFDNFNSVSPSAGGITMGHAPNRDPNMSVVVKNSSIDNSRFINKGPVGVSNGDATKTITAEQQAIYGYAPNPDGSGTTYTYSRSPIGTFKMDNVWFSRQPTGSSSLSGITDATLNNLHVAGQLVQYTSQFPLTTSGIGTLTTTYTDANGQTKNVKPGTLTNGDTWVGAWTGDQTKNSSSDLTLITRNTGVGLMGEQYTTGSGDGKLSYLQFPLNSLTRAPSQATLHLTYVGHRYSTVPSTDTDQLLVQPVSDTTCTGGGTSCPVTTMTWQNRPSFTATTSSVAKSATFTLGSTLVPEGGGAHQGNAIDGRDITVDITAFVQNAYAANQSTLLLAVGNAGGTNHELRFVSSEGAAGSGKLTNGTAEMAPGVTVTP